ncbi:hypothetical protein GCM10022254_64250 [Actinomadura meridiana]|uniref:Uncharacterized protein n=1 Tax=Actinomadura meridiana TaxID=559626 RepID=A0ABP8CK17_9ACTN
MQLVTARLWRSRGTVEWAPNAAGRSGSNCFTALSILFRHERTPLASIGPMDAAVVEPSCGSEVIMVDIGLWGSTYDGA